MGSGYSTDMEESRRSMGDEGGRKSNTEVDDDDDDDDDDGFPHNYEAILRDADDFVDRSSKEKLFEQLYAGVFLDQKKKKYWVDRRWRKNCFILFARDVSITWGEDKRYWHWPMHQESSEISVPVAELLNVCWLEIHGRFDVSKLSPETTYEVIFVVMLKDPAYGWHIPVNLRLILPDGSRQERKENLMEKARGKWIEIQAGEFDMRSMAKNGEIEFSIYEYEGSIWKRGLVIKNVVIRAKAA
ncbi:PREDICTED: lectin-like [Ipomoea nil]|uniref:lectin-like n=1 Tax=Ipomoea nil TaxID=35883 RepID=UPI000901E9CE|nr:PREDICTED: lectin-like [Ipomoea nil]